MTSQTVWKPKVREHIRSLSLSNTAARSVAVRRTTDPSSASFAREEPRFQVAHWDGQERHICGAITCVIHTEGFRDTSQSICSIFILHHVFFHSLAGGFQNRHGCHFLLFFPVIFYPPCPSMPFHPPPRVCVWAAFQPAPGCQLIVDNYSYLTAAFTASPFCGHLRRENMPSRGPWLPLWITTDTMAEWM